MSSAMSSRLAPANGLAIRSLRNIRRLPSAFVPALLMPLSQVVSFSGTYRGVTDIPGFPTDRSVNWYLPLAVTMGCSFAGLSAGFSMIRDLQSGFYDRLRMAPAKRSSLIAGPVFAAVVRAALVTVLVFLVGLLLGARLTGGVLGLLTLSIAGLGMSVIGTGWGIGLAYRFGDMRAAAIMQLTLLTGVFLTEAQTPIAVMDGWLKTVARFNPLTQVLRLSREGFVGDVSWAGSWKGLTVLAGLSVLALGFARTGLRKLDA
jgi:ABC-2 type transport system permease protein